MSKNPITKNTEKQLAEGERNWQQLKKEIAPFVKPRDERQYSTAGQWQGTRTAATHPTNGSRSSAAPK
jgi:hypothetical protein